MDDLDKDSEFLAYLYKEYVRLSELCDAYAKSSFDDFKLLGAIGALLVWKPIAELTEVSDPVILLGFLAILFIVVIIGARDLLKQSLINYYFSQIQIYESEIRKILVHPEAETFRFADNWASWSKQKHLPVTSRLYLLIAFPVAVLPTMILGFQSPRWYAVIYAFVALLSLAVYLNAAQVLYGKLKPILLNSRV